MIEVPLNNSPEQLFSITIDGSTYDCRVVFNTRSEVWSISFSQSGIDMVSGVALLGGVDILRQYNLPIRNAFVVNLDDPTLDATGDNLGTSAHLFILTDEEVTGG